MTWPQVWQVLITGQDEAVPVENCTGFRKLESRPQDKPRSRNNRHSTSNIISTGKKNKANDTDVYVLLQLKHYLGRGQNIPMVMLSPKSQTGFYENSDLENIDLRPLTTSETHTPRKTQTPGYLENTDPKFNIFQISILLSTFNFRPTIHQSAKGEGWGVRDTCAMSLYRFYTIEMNKQVSCFQIPMIRDVITERFGLTMTLPLPSENDCAFKTAASFSVCWIAYEKFPVRPRKHLCPGHHLIVLKK